MRLVDIQNAKAREWVLKAFATLGLIALLALGAWGIARIAISLPSILSSIGAAAVSLSSVFIPNERLDIALPSGTVKSGEPFTLSWKHANKRSDGAYTVSFTCRNALAIEAEAQGGSFQKVFCDTPFNFIHATETMKLIPTAGVRMLDVPFTVSLTRLSDGAVTASSEATVTVVNDSAPSAVPSASTTPPAQRGARRPGTESRNTYVVTASGRTSDPLGKPDLTVRILSLGLLDATDTFVPAQNIRAGSRAAVRFEIENAGTKTAEFWTFNATLPTSPFHIFHSDTQPSLGPGDKIQYTLGFDQIDDRATGGVITLNVDPTNSLFESSETNNIAKGTYLIFLR